MVSKTLIVFTVIATTIFISFFLVSILSYTLWYNVTDTAIRKGTCVLTNCSIEVQNCGVSCSDDNFGIKNCQLVLCIDVSESLVLENDSQISGVYNFSWNFYTTSLSDLSIPLVCTSITVPNYAKVATCYYTPRGGSTVFSLATPQKSGAALSIFIIFTIFAGISFIPTIILIIGTIVEFVR